MRHRFQPNFAASADEPTLLIQLRSPPGVDICAQTLFVDAMIGDHPLLSDLRPLRVPGLVLICLLVLAGISFSQARQVSLPPAPETLVLERVRIDEIVHRREPAGPSGPQLRTGVAVREAKSEQWPGISFRFSGAAAGLSIIPPVTLDLYLASSLREKAELRQNWPNVFPVLEVYGVVDNGQVLLDPAAAYAASRDRQQHNDRIGYGLLAAALLPAFIVFARLRVLWRRLTQ